MSQASFADESGIVRLKGTLTGGGGSQPWFTSGDGSPLGVLTPPDAGPALYFDTTNGALYIATGDTDADWKIAGGSNTELDVPGVSVQPDGSIAIICAPGSAGWDIADTFFNAGYGNGLKYAVTTDGTQTLDFTTGVGGSHNHEWAQNGVYYNANGIVFPTSDPLVAGAWWDNDGVLTKSTGA